MPKAKSNIKRVFVDITDDDVLDRCDTAFWAEHDRWCWRYKGGRKGFELVRNTSPNNNIISVEYQEIVNLTLREARDKHDAESWLRTYRGRAAMKAALEAL